MRKVYYIYNPKTRTYDRIYPTVRQRAISILRRLFVGMGLGAGSFIILLFIFGSPSEKELRIENARLLAQYNVLSHRLDEALGVMQDIQQRDDNLYRVVLQADPVSDAIRKAGYGGTNRYEQLMDMANAELVMNTTQKMDMLNRQLYIQSKSFDEVVDLCKGHDEMLKCIPAIMPVSNKDLKKTASGYGTRIDPIYNTPKFHAGMDFSANIGDTVKISYVDQNRAGLDPNKNLWEAVSDGLDFIEVAGVEVPTRAYVASFGFKGSDQQKLVGVLSGGERNRLNLALTLKQGGNLLLLDEPTNDLDVETLESLENALLAFPGCAVVISHDRWFLDRVATHILAWEGTDENPANWYWFEGNFQAYQENRIARLGEDAARPHRLHRKLTR